MFIIQWCLFPVGGGIVLYLVFTLGGAAIDQWWSESKLEQEIRRHWQDWH